MKKIKDYLRALSFGLYNSLITHFPSFHVRHFYLKKIIRIVIGKNSSVGIGCFITGRNIIIGHNCVINRNCLLDGRAGISIGDNVSISPDVKIISLTHDKDDPFFTTIIKPVSIKNYVWVGLGAMVLPGVKIDEGAIVGAGSVVPKDVIAYTVVAGNPAKLIGQRKKDLKYKLEYFPIFHSDECL